MKTTIQPLRIARVATILACLSPIGALAQPRTSSPEGATAYIVSPADGERVPSTFVVRFGLSGMGVAPAGVRKPGTGHFHLIVDGELPPLDRPMGKSVRHFGGGQIQTTLHLDKGKHTLQLILGDDRHVPHAPPVVSPPITITVE